MATKKSMTIIAVGFLLVFSLALTFRPVGAEFSAWYFCECMELMDEDKSWVEQNPDYAFLVSDGYYAQECRDALRSVQMSYMASGQLPPKYVEALQRRYEKNPTLVNIHVCGLDFKRCSDETKVLWGRYHDNQHLEAPAPSPN